MNIFYKLDLSPYASIDQINAAGVISKAGYDYGTGQGYGWPGYVQNLLNNKDLVGLKYYIDFVKRINDHIQARELLYPLLQKKADQELKNYQTAIYKNQKDLAYSDSVNSFKTFSDKFKALNIPALSVDDALSQVKAEIEAEKNLANKAPDVSVVIDETPAPLVQSIEVNADPSLQDSQPAEAPKKNLAIPAAIAAAAYLLMK